MVFLSVMELVIPRAEVRIILLPLTLTLTAPLIKGREEAEEGVEADLTPVHQIGRAHV